MTDKRALAYVNLFGILGSIPKLCELDKEARGLIAGEDISICFAVSSIANSALPDIMASYISRCSFMVWLVRERSSSAIRR